MLPEISQRCSSCGAAIREPAMFCPECGKSLTPASESQEASESSQGEQQSTGIESSTDEASPETPSPSTSVADAPAKESLEPEPLAATGEDEAKPIIIKPAAEQPGKVERTREKLHRASNAARGALKENVKRVDNIRQASSAVIEEATYDPSLRFVLVALGLFVVALILLILSKVMG